MANFQKATRLNGIRPSGLRKLFDLTAQMKSDRPIISLGLGDLNIGMHEDTVEAIQKAVQDPAYHRYGSNWGLIELRKEISARYKRDYDIDLNYDNGIVVTCGAIEALFDSIHAYVNPGDNVAVLDPLFRYFEYQSQVAGAKVTHVPMTPDFGIDLENAKEMITKDTKMLITNFPNNPTGSVVSKKSMKALSDICEDTGTIHLSDETYDRVVFDGAERFSSLEFGYEGTIVVCSFSKSYRMTGGRLGYVAGSKEMIAPIFQVHQYNTACANTAYQRGMAMAMAQSGDKSSDELIKILVERRDVLVDAIKKVPELDLGYTPRACFYAFPSVSGSGMNGDEFSEFALKEAQVVVVPGSEFSDYRTDAVRMSFGSASPDELKESMQRIKEALDAR